MTSRAMAVALGVLGLAVGVPLVVLGAFGPRELLGWAVLGGVIAAVGAASLFVARDLGARRIREAGTPTDGVIVRIEPSRTGESGGPLTDIVYRYADRAGRSHTARITLWQFEAQRFKPGDTVWISYDPSDPRKSAWVDLPRTLPGECDD